MPVPNTLEYSHAANGFTPAEDTARQLRDVPLYLRFRSFVKTSHLARLQLTVFVVIPAAVIPKKSNPEILRSDQTYSTEQRDTLDKDSEEALIT
jgi:hypothetical protein